MPRALGSTITKRAIPLVSRQDSNSATWNRTRAAQGRPHQSIGQAPRLRIVRPPPQASSPICPFGRSIVYRSFSSAQSRFDGVKTPLDEPRRRSSLLGGVVIGHQRLWGGGSFHGRLSGWWSKEIVLTFTYKFQAGVSSTRCRESVFRLTLHRRERSRHVSVAERRHRCSIYFGGGSDFFLESATTTGPDGISTDLSTAAR